MVNSKSFLVVIMCSSKRKMMHLNSHNVLSGSARWKMMSFGIKISIILIPRPISVPCSDGFCAFFNYFNFCLKNRVWVRKKERETGKSTMEIDIKET